MSLLIKLSITWSTFGDNTSQFCKLCTVIFMYFSQIFVISFILKRKAFGLAEVSLEVGCMERSDRIVSSQQRITESILHIPA